MKKVLSLGVIGLVAVFVSAGPATATVTIDTVPVGEPGNAGDTRYETPGYGAVAYEYNIGKYEVTAGQYCAFLNAVAATDTYGLYNTNMDTAVYSYGCNIKRAGSSGSYTYSVASDWANRPVNLVSWGDAARFANWLHNGQPTGAQNLSTTEDGAYYLNGATTSVQLLAVTRDADWTWAVTSEDEWYKAAYYKGGSTNAGYFDYPTSSDSMPSNDLVDPDPGNNATYYISGGVGDYTIGSPYYRTQVGAHENSDSPYGTFDQGGNVWEWNEAIIATSYRGVRGGQFNNSVLFLRASYRSYGGYHDPTDEYFYIGFRVSEVPEPSCLVLLVLGGVGMLGRRRIGPHRGE